MYDGQDLTVRRTGDVRRISLSPVWCEARCVKAETHGQPNGRHIIVGSCHPTWADITRHGGETFVKEIEQKR